MGSLWRPSPGGEKLVCGEQWGFSVIFFPLFLAFYLQCFSLYYFSREHDSVWWLISQTRPNKVTEAALKRQRLRFYAFHVCFHWGILLVIVVDILDFALMLAFFILNDIAMWLIVNQISISSFDAFICLILAGYETYIKKKKDSRCLQDFSLQKFFSDFIWIVMAGRWSPCLLDKDDIAPTSMSDRKGDPENYWPVCTVTSVLVKIMEQVLLEAMLMHIE